jgi:hypothetical protein
MVLVLENCDVQDQINRMVFVPEPGGQRCGDGGRLGLTPFGFSIAYR